MGVDCYCNFHSEPGSIPVPPVENTVNTNKKLKNVNSQPNEQDAYNKIATQNNLLEQKFNKTENSNIINNKDNNNNEIKKNLTNDQFEKIISEHSKSLSEEEFFLLIKGKIKEIETELEERLTKQKRKIIFHKLIKILYINHLYIFQKINIRILVHGQKIP